MLVTFPQRNLIIDLAKGILILFVVIGHSGSVLTKHIFWFHMPAFFFISGLLFKKFETWEEYKINLLKKYRNYGILYLSYFVIVIILSFLYINFLNFSWYKTFLKLIIGGRFVGRELGAFWYISCLVFSLTIFSLLLMLVKQKKYQYGILIVMYLLAHLEAFLQIHYNFTFIIPLNLDVALIAVCYIAAGFYLKGRVQILMNNHRHSIQIMFTTLILCIVLIAFDLSGIINYHLDMKSVIYNSLLGDILIPMVFTFFILCLSYLLNQSYIFKFLTYFGKYSIAIMFLHFTILEIYKHYFTYNWIIFSVLGTTIPLLFAMICDKFKLTRMLFLKGKV